MTSRLELVGTVTPNSGRIQVKETAELTPNAYLQPASATAEKVRTAEKKTFTNPDDLAKWLQGEEAKLKAGGWKETIARMHH